MGPENRSQGGGGGFAANLTGIGGYGWANERMTMARSLLQSVSGQPLVNRFLDTDLDDGDGARYSIAGAGTLQRDGSLSGGWYSFNDDANVMSIYLGDNQSGALIAHPSVEAWYAAVRLKIVNAPPVAAGKFIVPLQLWSTDGSASINIELIPADGSEFHLNLYDGSDHRFGCGSLGTLGTYTCPLDAAFVIGVAFHPNKLQTDGTTRPELIVQFNDTTALTITDANLAFMATYPALVDTFAKAAAIDYRIDSKFAAWGADR